LHAPKKFIKSQTGGTGQLKPIQLGAYFQAKIFKLFITPTHGLRVPPWIHLGVPQCPKTAGKITIFWLFLDHLSHKNGLFDLDSDPFSS
jgi:hypothetical protein